MDEKKEPDKKPDRSCDISQPLERLHPDEKLKHDSDYLRGSIVEGLKHPLTGSLPGEDPKLLKFHGIYQQDDRDLRDERRRQKLEPAYQFMVRVRLPGGVCLPDQWLKLAALAREYADNSLRLTTRQTFQFHGILKGDLKKSIQGIDAALLDTIAACGDGPRGVMCSVNPHLSEIHREVYELAQATSDHLLPRSNAYHEIWLDRERVSTPTDVEPIYGQMYLPRKFKIGFVIPPINDVDVYTQCVGFIAIVEEEKLAGFNVTVGGGMGRTDNEPETYPRLGDVVGFVPPERVVATAEAIATIQRDYGNRVDRKRARFKYTIDDKGLDWFESELQGRQGFPLEPARPFQFTGSGDEYGWIQGDDGLWHFTFFVENGRIRNAGEVRLMEGIEEIARVHEGEFRLTPNQNLTVSRITDETKPEIERLLTEYRIADSLRESVVRRNSMACVALPTCPLAMAESERYLPDLITKFEAILEDQGLSEEPIIVRMSGCNNGCSRPYVAEIGFSGRAIGKYNLYLGGGFHGERLAKMYLENVGEEEILATLRKILGHYAKDRRNGEHFGDFCLRAKYVPEVKSGREFND